MSCWNNWNLSDSDDGDDIGKAIVLFPLTKSMRVQVVQETDKNKNSAKIKQPKTKENKNVVGTPAHTARHQEQQPTTE